MPQNIDQGGSFATETYLPLEYIEQSIEESKPLGMEAYFLSEVVTESEPSAETLFLWSMDQGEPPATQLFVLEDSASSEPSPEALFLLTQSIDQGVLEDSTSSEPSAEALFLTSIDHISCC